MRAFDLSGADRQIIGEGFAIVQLISATYQIAMASAHWSLVVVHFRSFEMTSECLQRLVETPGFERSGAIITLNRTPTLYDIGVPLALLCYWFHVFQRRDSNEGQTATSVVAR
jgi:hypothetical protein